MEKILIVDLTDASLEIPRWLEAHFEVSYQSGETVEEHLQTDAHCLVLVCAATPEDFQPFQNRIEAVRKCCSCVWYGGSDELQAKFDGFEAGFDDVLPASMAQSEVKLRLERMMMHRVANSQLESMLANANQAAYAAMNDVSDLGVNNQFLLESGNCHSYDELTQCFFRTMNHYGLKVSVQIRGMNETRNFEANGLPKELESQLMTEFSHAGRYVDFGRRTLCNYDNVTVLIKNMPVDDELQYGRVKDNTFSLIQGLSFRVKAIDNANELLFERDLMYRLTQRMHHLINTVENTNQDLMRGCAEVIEYTSAQIEEALQFLDLTEEQENTILAIINSSVDRINDQFSAALKADESFTRLVQHIETTLQSNDASRMHQLAERL